MIKFGKEVGSALNKWHADKISHEKVKQIAQKLAKMLGLKETIARELIELTNSQIIAYTSYHADKNNRMYLIRQNAHSVFAKSV